MPKRSGLGKRGLDLLISASGNTRTAESELEDSPQTKKPPSGRRTAAQKEQAKTGTAKKSPSVSSSAGRGAGSDRAAQTQGPDKPADTRKFDTDRKTEPGRMRTAADETGTQPGPGAVQNDDQALSGPVMVPLSQVEPNRAQPRKNFDEDALQELAESVRQYGIIQPLIVQKKDGYYPLPFTDDEIKKNRIPEGGSCHHPGLYAQRGDGDLPDREHPERGSESD